MAGGAAGCNHQLSLKQIFSILSGRNKFEKVSFPGTLNHIPGYFGRPVKILRPFALYALPTGTGPAIQNFFPVNINFERTVAPVKDAVSNRELPVQVFGAQKPYRRSNILPSEAPITLDDRLFGFAALVFATGDDDCELGPFALRIYSGPNPQMLTVPSVALM